MSNYQCGNHYHTHTFVNSLVLLVLFIYFVSDLTYKMPGNCTFNTAWSEMTNYKDWIQPDTDKNRAWCKVCSKSIMLKTMGVTALDSHRRGSKHKEKIKIIMSNVSLTNCLSSSSSSAVTSSSTASTSVSRPQSTVKTVPAATATTSKTAQKPRTPSVPSSDILKTEILWAFNVVNNGYSFSSVASTGAVFRSMFPDSDLAQAFQCGKTKCSYIVNHGIAPHLKRTLQNKLKNEDSFVVLLDESLNKDIQQKQLDFLIRHWDTDKIVTRYYSSEFMGHCKADDLLESCVNNVEELGLRKILQVSLDGPTVNLSFYSKLADLLEQQNAHMIDIGTCPLHKAHNAFHFGSNQTDWDLQDFLDSLYRILKNFPARRDDYIKICNEHDVEAKFPKKFCPTRWVENSDAADRAIEVIPMVRKFVATLQTESRAFKVLKEHLSDPLLEAKLATFSSLATILEDYLVPYQTTKPMIPFLAGDIESLLRKLMKKVLKSSVVDGKKSLYMLLSIDIHSSDDHKPHTLIYPGFRADTWLKKLLSQKKISERSALQFRMNAKQFILGIIQKLLDKNPAKLSMVRNVSVLDPRVITSESHDKCQTKFSRVMNVLVEVGRVNEHQAEQVLQQFDDFYDQFKGESSLVNFDKKKDRLDSTYHMILHGKDEYRALWSVVKQILLLSHGQADIERGFSTNKELTTTNIEGESLIAKRLIKDHVSVIGGLDKVVVTPSLLISCSNARSKYYQDLGDKKKEKEGEIAKRKRKLVETELNDVTKKAKLLESEIDSLEKSVVYYAQKAEDCNNMTFLQRSNRERITKMRKQSELENVNAEITEKRKQLANM